MYRTLPVLCFLISLSTIYTKEVSVQIINQKECVYVRYGENLEIFCKAGEGYSSKDIIFKLPGKIEKFQIVNDTTIRLYKEKPEAGKHTYYCQNTVTLKNALQRVIVVSAPQNVTDFQCKSWNFEELECEWKSHDRYVATNYSLTSWFGGNPQIPCMPHVGNDSISKCIYKIANSRPLYVPFDKILHFTLKSTNIIDEIVQDFYIDHYSIIKPAAPLNLRAVRIGPHEVILKWDIHYNLQDFLVGKGKGLDHRTEYRIQGDYDLPEINKAKEVDATGLPISKSTYSLHLTLPYAYVTYEILIRIKTKEAIGKKFWSDPGKTLIRTESEIPGRPPETAVGAFLQSSYENHRSVIIFWKKLDLYELCGPNFKYKILVSTSVSTETFFVDENSLTKYTYMNASLDALHIRIWSLNEKGSSTTSSYMHVPAKAETTSLTVNRFTIFNSEDGVYNFLWDAAENVDNYTLFWTDNDKKGFQYKYLQPKENQHTLHLGVGNEYKFYIAANKGTTTTGMVSAENCELQSNNIGMYDFPVNLIKVSVERTKAKLKWSLGCKLSEGIVLEYRAVLKGLDTEYLNGWKMKAYDSMEKEITDLKPYKKYIFALSLKTKVGPKNISITTIETLEGTPTKPRDLTVTTLRSDSMLLSWEHPYELNGNSKHIVYRILYTEENNINSYTEQVMQYMQGRMSHQISKLKAYTSYKIKMKACNTETNECSDATKAIVAKTRMGEPSAPVNIMLNDQFLSWGPPLKPGGNVAMYEILIQRGNKSNIERNITNVIYNVLGCDMTGQIVKYKVRAVNYDGSAKYEGKWSDEISDRCPYQPPVVFVIAGVLILLSSAKISFCMYKKWNKMKIDEPIFPAGIFVLQNDSMKENKHDVINETNMDKNTDEVQDAKELSELEPLQKFDVCDTKVELNGHIELQKQNVPTANEISNTGKTPDLRTSYVQMQFLDSLPGPKHNQTQYQKVSQGYVSVNDALSKHLNNLSIRLQEDSVSLSSHYNCRDQPTISDTNDL